MKKKIIFPLLLCIIGATGFSQSLSLDGVPFRCPNLDVRWHTATNALPESVWVYRLLSARFPASAISNLVALGAFTERDRKNYGDAVVYRNREKAPTRQLVISSPHGSIYYENIIHYSPTNLAQGVPAMDQMPQLTSHFLADFGIHASDITKTANGAPDFHFWQPLQWFYVHNTFITNIAFRAVNFSRAVDGAPVFGAGTGGYGEIEFGEHGKIVKMDLSWRDLVRYKSYSSAAPETMMQWIRAGKAVEGSTPGDMQPIDWSTVRSLTVHKASLAYYAGTRFEPSDWLMPLASLMTTVDTGHGNIDLEIDCPVIDETKPLKSGP